MVIYRGSEKRLISAFLRGDVPRGHIKEEFVLEKREVPEGAKRNFHMRADIVIMAPTGQIHLFEAKVEANPAQLGQLLVYRELLLGKFPERHVIMHALCRRCSETMQSAFASHLVNVVVVDVAG